MTNTAIEQVVKNLIFGNQKVLALKHLRETTSLGLKESMEYMESIMGNAIQLNWFNFNDEPREIYVNDVYLGDIHSDQLFNYRTFVLSIYDLILDKVVDIKKNATIKCVVKSKNSSFQITWNLLRQERLSLEI